MYAVRLALVFALPLLSACVQKSEKAVANDDIRDTFRRFRMAVEAKSSAAAVDELSQETLADYARVRMAALYSSPDELMRLPLDVRLDVLQLRGRMGVEALMALEGRGLVELYVARGWLNSDLIAQIRLGTVIHTARGAEVRFADDVGDTTHRLVFRKEGDAWKFDMSAARWMQRKHLERLAEGRGLSERELLDDMVKATIGARTATDLWMPLAPIAPSASEQTHS
jgi:hypothetical protein